MLARVGDQCCESRDERLPGPGWPVEDDLTLVLQRGDDGLERPVLKSHIMTFFIKY